MFRSPRRGCAVSRPENFLDLLPTVGRTAVLSRTPRPSSLTSSLPPPPIIVPDRLVLEFKFVFAAPPSLGRLPPRHRGKTLFSTPPRRTERRRRGAKTERKKYIYMCIFFRYFDWKIRGLDERASDRHERRDDPRLNVLLVQLYFDIRKRDIKLRSSRLQPDGPGKGHAINFRNDYIVRIGSILKGECTSVTYARRTSAHLSFTARNEKYRRVHTTN